MKPVSVRRVLPAVVVVGALLLGVKGEALVRTALAEGLGMAGADTSILAKDTAPLDTGADIAGAESAGRNDVLARLGMRREALDKREAALNDRVKMVNAAEKRIDGKIQTLQDLTDKIKTLMGQRDQAEKDQINNLVKTYSSMKPRDAARIFNTLSDNVLIPVAAAMKPDALAPVMAAMDSNAAQALTIKLSQRLKAPKLAAPAVADTDAELICKPGAGAGVAVSPETAAPAAAKSAK